MQERASELGGQLIFESSAEKGTCVKFTIALNNAPTRTVENQDYE
jgi:nitrate/nitrite-specific signal transduction histidine kinase